MSNLHHDRALAGSDCAGGYPDAATAPVVDEALCCRRAGQTDGWPRPAVDIENMKTGAHETGRDHAPWVG